MTTLNYLTETTVRTLQQQDSFLTTTHAIGAIIMATVAGLSSLAGLGGGGPNVVVMLIFFDVMPKDATIIVFSAVLGSSMGNTISQMGKAINGEAVVNYKTAFMVLPLMFLGSLFGVFLNNWLPSAAVAAIIIGVATQSLPKIYQRFKKTHT